MSTINIGGQPVEGARIDELDQTVLHSRDHVVPAMHDGITVKLSVAQILTLLRREDLLGELFAEDLTYDPHTIGALAAETAQDAIDEIAAVYISTRGQSLSSSEKSQARENIGLGNSATRDVGTTAGTVAAGDDGRFINNPYGRSNILGTVSQSGGVPTGAIIERGSNANGEYVRFADGTQITTRTNAAVSDAGVTITHAATFASSPAVTANARSVLSGSLGGSYVIEVGDISTTEVTVKAIAHLPDSVTATTVACTIIAIGRWF